MFQYHLDEVIPLELLAEVVSTLYYPLDVVGEAKGKYKKSLVFFMKEYNNQEKVMNEDQFGKFLQDMGRQSNEDYNRKLS